LYLRDRLNAAAANPENPGTIAIGDTRTDELGEVMRQFDGLLHQVSGAHLSARERLAAMVDNSANAVFAAEPDGRLVYANRAALELSKVDGIEQLNHLDLPLITTAEGRAMPLARYLLNGKGTAEVELRDAEGQRIICMLGLNQLAGRDGRASLHYAWAIDITERRRGEEALLRALDDAKIANRAKTEFLANMSHELRTPLNAIIGFSEVIVEETYGPVGHERYSEYIHDIHDSGEHLLAIINDILDLSRIEAGMTTLSEGEVDLIRLIDDSVRIAQGRADSGQIEVVWKRTAGLPHLICDDRLLKQVLLNILSNALKFTPEGGQVTITARLATDGGIRIMVSDSGIGIPADRLNDMVRPFTQIEDSHVRRHEGAGLGLPLSKQFVELHGGSLDIESTVGQGTTVTIHLPAERVQTRAICN
jgi:PAS domain S-box-containing protein